MKITKSILRSLVAGGLAGIVAAILFPGVTELKVMLCILCIVGLTELVKADLRADLRVGIRDDALLLHEGTRVWLRDWFDHDHRHCVTSIPFDPNHLNPWVAFEQRYGTKKRKMNDEGKDE